MNQVEEEVRTPFVSLFTALTRFSGLCCPAGRGQAGQRGPGTPQTPIEQPQLGLSPSGRAEVSALPHLQLSFGTLFALCLTTVALFELCLHPADLADSPLTWIVGRTARGDAGAV